MKSMYNEVEKLTAQFCREWEDITAKLRKLCGWEDADEFTK